MVNIISLVRRKVSISIRNLFQATIELGLNECACNMVGRQTVPLTRSSDNAQKMLG